METFSALLSLCEGNPPATSGFPSQRPVTRNFDVFFDLHLNKMFNKHPRRRWYETSSRSLSRHCVMLTEISELARRPRKVKYWLEQWMCRKYHRRKTVGETGARWVYFLKIGFYTLRPRQNGRRYEDGTFKRNFLKEMLEFRLRFHWSLFLRVQLTIC